MATKLDLMTNGGKEDPGCTPGTRKMNTAEGLSCTADFTKSSRVNHPNTNRNGQRKAAVLEKRHDNGT